jgi:hypothetical protein
MVCMFCADYDINMVKTHGETQYSSICAHSRVCADFVCFHGLWNFHVLKHLHGLRSLRLLATRASVKRQVGPCILVYLKYSTNSTYVGVPS